jgi:hypothetical protein
VRDVDSRRAFGVVGNVGDHSHHILQIAPPRETVAQIELFAKEFSNRILERPGRRIWTRPKSSQD